MPNSSHAVAARSYSTVTSPIPLWPVRDVGVLRHRAFFSTLAFVVHQGFNIDLAYHLRTNQLLTQRGSSCLSKSYSLTNREQNNNHHIDSWLTGLFTVSFIADAHHQQTRHAERVIKPIRVIVTQIILEPFPNKVLIS